MADCTIVGVLDNGPAGVTWEVLQLIRRADLLIGNARTFGLFSAEIGPEAETRDLSGHFSRVPGWIEAALEQGRDVVVLATGDPLCHGIARTLMGRLGRARCRVIPNVTTLQLAFARLGLAWQEASICSIHGKDLGEWHPDADARHGLYPLLRKIRQQQLLGIFTSRDNGPDRIARMLERLSLAECYQMAVVERLLLPDERLYDFMPVATVAQRRFADPNVVILRPLSPCPAEVLFGLPDAAYRQRRPERGLITRREVRAVSLALLQLRRDSLVWDIGAGAGSVGMEAARLCPDGFVYAIEKNRADAAIIRQNQQRLRLTNYRLTQARAPQGLAQWPDPDAVFIGGSGGALEPLIETALERLSEGGSLVMNFVTLENLNRAIEQLKREGAEWTLSQLQLSRSKPIQEMQRLVAESPVWIVSAKRGDR